MEEVDNIIERTGTGSTPQTALALVVVPHKNYKINSERPAFVNHDGPTETRYPKKFLPCFHHCLFLTSGPIICKSTTGYTTSMANCRQECLSTRNSLHLGASGSIGLHRLIQPSL